jgi:hypothetical protein
LVAAVPDHALLSALIAGGRWLDTDRPRTSRRWPSGGGSRLHARAAARRQWRGADGAGDIVVRQRRFIDGFIAIWNERVVRRNGVGFERWVLERRVRLKFGRRQFKWRLFLRRGDLERRLLFRANGAAAMIALRS